MFKLMLVSFLKRLEAQSERNDDEIEFYMAIEYSNLGLE